MIMIIVGRRLWGLRKYFAAIISLFCALSRGAVFPDSMQDTFPLEHIPYSSTHYTRDTGLPSLNMDSVVQDRFGFLYFSTKGSGLYKYDGHKWFPINRETAGLADNRIVDIVYDGVDTIYIIHPLEKISILNILKEEAATLQFEVPDQSEDINKVINYPSGYLCITTATQGMIMVDTITGEQVYFGGSNPRLQIFGGGWQNFSAGFVDSKGRCWFGTSRGVMLFDGKEFYRYFPYADGQRRDVRQIGEQPGDGMFVVTDRFVFAVDEEKGVVEVSPRFALLNEQLKIYRAARNNSLLYDVAGRPLLATSGGVFFLEGETLSLFSYKNNRLVSDSLNSIFMDREKSIWVLSENGVSKLRSVVFQNYNSIHGIDLANVFYEDTSFTRGIISRPTFNNSMSNTWLYFREDYYIVELFKDRYRMMKLPDQFGIPNIQRIINFRDDVYIQPVWNPDLYLYNPRSMKFVLDTSFAFSNIQLEHKGKIFRFYPVDFVLQQYLSVTDKETGESKSYRATSEVALFSDRCTMFVDKEDDNKVWLTQFRNKSVAYYFDMRDEKFYFWGVEGELGNAMGRSAELQNIALWPDGDGSFWLLYTAADSSLFHYEAGGLVDYIDKLNLKGMSIVDIKVDSRGRLLLATEGAGLFVYDGKNCLNYSTAEGLAGDRLSGGISISRDNAIFVMSRTVLSRFDDSVIQEPEFHLHFYRIEDINNKFSDIPLQGEGLGFTLPLGMRNLTLYVSANSFLAERELRYSFQPEWIQSDWQQEQVRNFYNLTALTPGDYTISVRVRDHLNRGEETTFQFTIPPFWYETMGARIGFLIIFISFFMGSISFIVSLNSRRLNKRAMELQNIIEEKTTRLKETQQELLDAARSAGRADIAVEVLHAIGNTLTSILVQVEMNKNSLEKSSVEKILKISNLINGEGLIPENSDPRLKKAFEYLALLGNELEREKVIQENGLASLEDKLNTVSLIVQKQNEYAQYSFYNESVNLISVMEDTFSFLIDEFKEISLIKNYPQEAVLVKGQKSKILYILVSLCRYAVEEVNHLPADVEKRIVVEISISGEKRTLSITDNGGGIEKKDLVSVFDMSERVRAGSNREQEKTFILHTCANFMTEMKGRINLSSPGPDAGNTFTLEW